MTTPLAAIKCCSMVFLGNYRSYHLSSALYKWPAIIKRNETHKLRDLPKTVKVWEGMTVFDLAMSMRKDLGYVNEVLKPSFANRMDSSSGEIKDIRSITTFLNKENIDYKIILNHNKNKTEENKKLPLVTANISTENLIKRPPIVTIMGHVDHGKTTLLDALRNSNIVAKEFGGITQHIGAFSVTLSPGRSVTFIDTPGHAAFSSMRNRGAEITDIVVLIVAADDGVMEQTIESVNMAKNAGVKIIVAVNKIDKGQNNMAEIKMQLLKEGIQAEDLGGNVQFIPISALKRINLDTLIEAILLESDMMSLTGDPTAPVQAVVIESSVGNKGKVATLIVKHGILRKRTVLLAGTSIARVRGMFDEDGRELSEVTLSQPVQVIGWKELPKAGENVFEIASQKQAQLLKREKEKICQKQKMVESYIPIQEKALQDKAKVIKRQMEYVRLRESRNIEELKKFFAYREKEEVEKIPKFNIIVKGDVDGSVEAILDILDTYDAKEECDLNLIHFAVGEVTQTDLELAKSFNAIIYCFNLNFPQNLKSEIVSNDITIKFHNVIYNLVDDIKNELTHRIPTVEEDDIIGTGEVLQHFTIGSGKKQASVAGSVCLTGEFSKNHNFRVIRDGEVIFEGPVQSLKHFKNEVSTVKKDTQCGIMLKDFQDSFKSGDKIICFQKKEVKYPTSWNPGF